MTHERDDFELLRDYVERRSEAAFTELVNRHLGLVYAAALRQVRDPHVAEEIAQVSFIILARKAHALKKGTLLSGWLYRTARFAARDALKMNRRRLERELAAMQVPGPGRDEGVWSRVQPFLDEVLSRLGETDRSALLLRFFEDKSLAEVGAALGVSEEAARKRIARVLERMRALFKRHGVTISAAALAALLSEEAAHSTPTGLASHVAAIAAAKGATAAAATLALANSTLKLMTRMKIKTALATGAVVLAIAGSTTYALEAGAGQPPAKPAETAAANPTAGPTTTVPPTPAPPPPAGAKPGELRISMHFMKAKLEEAVLYLRVEGTRLNPALAGFKFVISPAAASTARPITLDLDSVGLEQALAGICDTANVKYTMANGVIGFYAMTENTPVPALPNASLQVETPASKATMSRLQSIIIDKVDFQGLDVEAVLEFLTAKSRALDPDHKGVNFVLGAINPGDHVHRRVSITLDNVPISDLLSYINQQTNLRYSLGDNVVTFKP